MANPGHLQILKQGVETWNTWRDQHKDITPNLGGADLGGAELSEVRIYETIFGDTNLITVRGLETCQHDGPSILDHRTLAKSGPLPLAFLRGCGLPDALIDYLPSLVSPSSSTPASSATRVETTPLPNASTPISRTKACGAGLPRKT